MLYSCLLIHISWKAYSEARIEPSIHTEELCFDGAMILILITARAVITCILSAMQGVCGGPIRQHCVGIQILLDVNIIFYNGVECGLVDTTGLHTQEGGLEERLRTLESLVADGDHLPLSS